MFHCFYLNKHPKCKINYKILNTILLSIKLKTQNKYSPFEFIKFIINSKKINNILLYLKNFDLANSFARS